MQKIYKKKELIKKFDFNKTNTFLLSVTTKKVTVATSNNASFIFGAKTKVLA